MLFFQIVQVIAVALVGGLFAEDITIRTYSTRINVKETIGTGAVFESELEHVADISLYYVYVAVPFVTAMHYAFTLYFWEGKPSKWYHFQHAVTKGYYPVRWIEYAISASIMTFALGLLCGLTDIVVLAQLMSVNVAVQLFGLSSEAVAAKTNKKGSIIGKYELFLYGALVFCISWFSSIFASFVKHASEAPDFVVVLVIGITLLYASFPFVHFKYLRGWSFQKADRAYDTLSVTSKLFLDWVIVGGLIGWSRGDHE